MFYSWKSSVALSSSLSLFSFPFPSVHDGCFLQIKCVDLHSFGLYSASNNVTVVDVNNEVGRPVQEVPFCCVYYHKVLLIKQVSVLTRKIKTEDMNRSKGFPSVLVHLFILVFKFALFFFPWLAFLKEQLLACEGLSWLMLCQFSCYFMHSSGRLINLFFSSVSKCSTWDSL